MQFCVFLSSFAHFCAFFVQYRLLRISCAVLHFTHFLFVAYTRIFVCTFPYFLRIVCALVQHFEHVCVLCVFVHHLAVSSTFLHISCAFFLIVHISHIATFRTTFCTFLCTFAHFCALFHSVFFFVLLSSRHNYTFVSRFTNKTLFSCGHYLVEVKLTRPISPACTSWCTGLSITPEQLLKL